MHRHADDILRVFARQIKVRRGIGQVKAETQLLKPAVLLLHFFVDFAVFNERLISGGNHAHIRLRRAVVVHHHLIAAPRQVQAAVFVLRLAKRLDGIFIRSPEVGIRARLRGLLFQRHRRVGLCLPRVGFFAGDHNLPQLVALITPRVFISIRINEDQSDQRQPKPGHAQPFLFHLVKPPKGPIA